MGESLTNLGFFEIKKSKIPKFDENPPKILGKSQALETLVITYPLGMKNQYVFFECMYWQNLHEIEIYLKLQTWIK